MPRYFTFIKTDESMPAGPPPPALFEAIAKLGEEATKDGTMVMTGGLLPSANGALLTLENGTIDVIDGPFAETKELIGGFALFELRDKAEAVERARRFLQLHVDHWPGFEGTVEVRELAEQVPGAPGQ
ncbi:MAG TPA: YciI family protein [Jatrophihabitantaceae bacterium]|nr:YciI family protein [Jatrophihabitantaceae bacterium]